MKKPDWPVELIDEEEVRNWISNVLVNHTTVEGPASIDRLKPRGIVARFNIQNIKYGKQEIVFKASHLPLFTYGPFVDKLLMEYCPDSVPEMLEWQAWPDKTWIIFRPFSAQLTSTMPGLEPIIKIAQSFAQIQTIIAGIPITKKENIPHTKVCNVPEQFEKIIQDIEDRQWKIWSNDRAEFMDPFQIPDDLCNKLRTNLPKINRWTDELSSMNWPDTIDHVDLHNSNAAMFPDGRLLIFDWEEALISCPFFSIDRLLNDARDLDIDRKLVSKNYDGKYSQSELFVRKAYLEAIPWKSYPERERGFDIAMCLSPIKTAYEGFIFAQERNLKNGLSYQTAMCITRALRRWESLME